MHYAFRMCSFERQADLLHYPDRFVPAKFPLFTYDILEVLALDEIHRDELDPLSFTEIENADHVSVGHLARQD